MDKLFVFGMGLLALAYVYFVQLGFMVLVGVDLMIARSVALFTAPITLWLMAAIGLGGRSGKALIAVWLIALCAMFFFASPAAAQTVAPAASTIVDFSSVVTMMENVVFSLVAAGFAWLLHRAVTAIEGWSGSQLTVLHGTILDSAVTEALGLARSKLDAALHGKTQVDVHNQLAATAASLVVSKVPETLAALGLDEDDIIAKIKGLLGLELSPIQTVAAPAAPATDTDSLVAQIIAGVSASLAPAPLAAPSMTTTANAALAAAALASAVQQPSQQPAAG